MDGPGWFVQPTALTGLTPDMRVYREEVFGPVASFFRAGDIDEAIALANDTSFGLSSSVWTEDAPSSGALPTTSSQAWSTSTP